MSTRFDDDIELAWSHFEAELEQALAEMDIRSFSIDVPGETEETGAYPYVQFAGDGHMVRAEVSSNEVLDGAHRMSPKQEASLVALGWQRPTEGHGPNWWCEVPDHMTQVVLPMVTAAFRQVFAIVHPDFLVSDELWPDDDEESSLELPVPGAVDIVRVPDDHEDLVAMVAATLQGGSCLVVERDSDGDFPLMPGRVPFWIRVHPGKPMVRLFGFVVTSVRNMRQARMEVGLLNQRQDYLKFTLRDGTITATYDLPASPYAGELLRSMVMLFSEELDELATDTAVPGGRRALARRPRVPRQFMTVDDARNDAVAMVLTTAAWLSGSWCV